MINHKGPKSFIYQGKVTMTYNKARINLKQAFGQAQDLEVQRYIQGGPINE